MGDGDRLVRGADYVAVEALREIGVKSWLIAAGWTVLAAALLMVDGDGVQRRDAAVHAGIWLAGVVAIVVMARRLRMWAREKFAADARLRMWEVVFDGSPEGIMITDAQNKILAVNPAFSAVTGYAPGDVVGRNPGLLRSGRHEADYYRGMWESVNNQGRWQGEIWDRHRDGNIYPQWLSISAVRDESGAVANYIGIFVDMAERRKMEENIRFLAYHDELTGLPNRALLDERLARALAHSGRAGTKVAVMFIDLDRFKDVNDTFGHHFGDRLLQEAARRLLSCLRARVDTVSRRGGDEFVILVKDVGPAREVAALAERMVAELSAPYVLNGVALNVTVSIGISIFPDDGADAETLIKNADSAMYQAKENGRNAYCFFTAKLNRQVTERLALENDLRGAVERGEFVIHYQPQVDIENGGIHGVEALVRWQHPRLGMMLPARFIPLAEETGLIVKIGEWVIREACRQHMAWVGRGLPPLRMAVNISAVQFRQEGFVRGISAIITEMGMAPSNLELEITESVLLDGVDKVAGRLSALRDMGASLSLDNFGMGYPTLHCLRSFPLVKLKIDRAFIGRIVYEPETQALVEAVIKLSHRLGLEVVAEGVENQVVADMLRRRKCDQMQGYLVSAPMGGADFEAWLANRLGVK